MLADSPRILQFAIGADGENGSHGSFEHSGHPGHAGDAGADITFDNSSPIGNDRPVFTNIAQAIMGDFLLIFAKETAIWVSSWGGNGGNGGKSGGGIHVHGGRGGRGGDGGDIDVTNEATGTISTNYGSSHGIFVNSYGGEGGNAGGAGTGIGNSGNDGGVGGNGGDVTIDNAASVSTQGDASNALYALSKGGGGGNGSGSGWLGGSGDGGDGNNGGSAEVTNTGALLTGAANSYGILSASIGGNGGDGGSGSGLFLAFGASGGKGGNGGFVKVEHSGSLTTEGDGSTGILAHSIGGGGGHGGNAADVGVSAGLAVGGSGGGGGAGGKVEVGIDASGSISTSAANAPGVIAQSIGGGGGAGGNAIGAAVGEVSVQASFGGSGGSGGAGGAASVDNAGTIETLDHNSAGVLIQSVGGGGGHGGNAVSIALSAGEEAGSASIGIGGSGGSGGHATEVQGTNSGSITTWSSNSPGMLAQAIGGGGGNGGNVVSVAASVGEAAASASVAVGGSGGSGGDGGAWIAFTPPFDFFVPKNELENEAGAVIETNGHRSPGMLLQSIGGGGGSGGNVYSFSVAIGSGSEEGDETAASVNVGIGGNGAVGGNGMTVTATNAGTISTQGENSHGAVAQSVGGGGGAGGHVVTVSATTAFASGGEQPPEKGSTTRSVTLALGGKGGAGGNGGAVNMFAEDGSSISTSGNLSTGMLAQSIGGGGGDGGHVVAVTFGKGQKVPDPETESTTKRNTAYNFNIGIGGNGGSGGNGNNVDVEIGREATIMTAGTGSKGVVAQSIGGGGGTGGRAHSSSFLLGNAEKESISVHIGGSGGRGGDGGEVAVQLLEADQGVALDTDESPNGAVITLDDQSHAIMAQSIGGGGGSISTSSLPSISIAQQIADLYLGPSSGASGSGGTVTVSGLNAVHTAGTASFGILAQSIGGGGGEIAHQMSAGDSGTVTLGVGGESASGANGGFVLVEDVDYVQTSGDLAHGIVVQSIGGSGGAATLTNLSGLDSVTLTTTMGASARSSGNGGNVEVNLDDDTVITTGDQAFGIIAQSIGGSGGLVAVEGGGSSLTNTTNIMVGNQGGGGAVDVTLGADSMVSTAGPGAVGVFAQSVGGGGGLVTFSGDLVNTTRTTTELASEGADVGGDVTVNAQGTIQTTGLHAHGIFAMSTAGATVFQSDINTTKVFGGAGSGQSGTVTITQSGTVLTSGFGATGISAFAHKSDGIGIDITVGGTVAAVGNGVAAVRAINKVPGAPPAACGNIETTTIQIEEGALVTAGHLLRNGRMPRRGGKAILVRDELGSFDVGISGTVVVPGITYGTPFMAVATSGNGSVTVTDTGSVTGAIRSDGVGDVWLVNDGRIDGEARNLANYVLGSTGNHFIALTPSAATAGGITTQEMTIVGGAFHPYLTEFSRLSAPTEIINVTTLPDGIVERVVNTPVVAYTAVASGSSVNITDVDVDFLRPGLRGNAGKVAALADPVVRKWINGTRVAAGDRQLYAILLDAANAEDRVTLRDQLSSQLDASQHYGLTVAHHTAAIAHLDTLHSCGVEDGPWAMIREGECAWAKATYGYTRLNDANMKSRDTGFAAGSQFAFDDVWRVGFGGAFERTRFSSAASQSDGYRVHGGGVVKYTDGPWLASASLSASYSWADAQRQLIAGGRRYTAFSDQRALAASARLRAARAFAFDGWYAIPTLDLDLSWVHDYGYRERNAGSAGLRVHADDSFLFDVHPKVVLGTEFRFGEHTVMRPYLEAGALFAVTDHSIEQSLLGSLGGARASMEVDREDIKATFAAGLSLFSGERVEAKLRYDGAIGQDSLSHTGSLKIGIRF
ncbi:MAG: hypothetical protein C0606_10875 [Hyphomicrobiales bacterium]|nr:MAG: hypothetical protein C0606_10875 [Hyphomicrobiales bacterium]